MKNRPLTLFFCLAAILCCSNGLAYASEAKSDEDGQVTSAASTSAAPTKTAESASHMAAEIPLYTVIPFAALLLCIAILPLFAPHWWEHNTNKGIVVAILAAPVAAYLWFVWGHEGGEQLLEKGQEFIEFIALLGALFVISGGVYVKGSLSGTPLVNTAVLALGAVLANLIGTTGASVLLIRPLLRANKSREAKAHIVIFFIFVVSNCGGLLTPVGDPPLFLGFLKGVPFQWTLRLWPQWVLVNGALIGLFNIWDQIVFNREEVRRPGSQLEEVMKHEPLRILGWHNIFFLAGVVAVIIASGQNLLPDPRHVPFVREAIMLGLALAAYFLTSAENRSNNRFSFTPIIEVAVLFAGIFITMAPALQILNAWGEGDRKVFDMGFGMSHPWEFFWAAGALSSFLDNAPTYLTFAATACGMEGVEVGKNPYLLEFLAKGPEAGRLLAAISCGAVFMGANTYIGNGPNFMVKAIAEENGVKMPGFFGYMLYSGGILIPIFVVVTLLFFADFAPWR